jgi:4-amino-4-deoxy-L-arabinose transferase-like glycosyltransferase
MMSRMSRFNTSGHLIALSAIVAAALAARLWGVNFALPHFSHPDEWALLQPAIGILQTGNLDPGRFDYGSLYIYVQTIVLGLVYVIGKMFGVYSSSADFAIYEQPHSVFIIEQPEIYLFGRIITVILGTLTVVLLYFIGKQIHSKNMGLVAALFMAFFPRHVVNSHFITTDIPVTFMISLSFLLSLRILAKGSYQRYLIAGLACGLTVSTKYPGGFVFIALLAAHFLRKRSGLELRKLFVAALAVGAGFVLTSPYTVIDLPRWFEWLGYVNGVYNPQDIIVTGSSGIWYARYLLSFPQGIYTLAALAGLSWMAIDRNRVVWMIAPTALGYFVVISTQGLRYPRTTLPLTPFIVIAAAYFVVRLAIWLNAHWKWANRHKSATVAFIGLLVVFFPLLSTLGYASRFTQPDLRETTREWIGQNVEPGSKIAMDFSGPVLPPGQYDELRTGWFIPTNDLSWYIEEQFDYIAISSILRESPNRTVTAEKNYTAFLADEALVPVATIEGHVLGQPGYNISIYQIAHEE